MCYIVARKVGSFRLPFTCHLTKSATRAHIENKALLLFCFLFRVTLWCSLLCPVYAQAHTKTLKHNMEKHTPLIDTFLNVPANSKRLEMYVYIIIKSSPTNKSKNRAFYLTIMLFSRVQLIMPDPHWTPNEFVIGISLGPGYEGKEDKGGKQTEKGLCVGV